MFEPTRFIFLIKEDSSDGKETCFIFCFPEYGVHIPLFVNKLDEKVYRVGCTYYCNRSEKTHESGSLVFGNNEMVRMILSEFRKCEH